MSNPQPAPPAMESIDQFVHWAVETAQIKGPKIVDWLYTEVPEVVEQFLIWGFAESFLTFVVSLFFIAAYPYLLYKVARCFYIKFKVADMYDEAIYWAPTSVFVLTTVIISQVISWHVINFHWLKIWLAPKVYLLETFANVVK